MVLRKRPVTFRWSLMKRAAFTAVSTLKLMSTFSSVSRSISLIMGTCGLPDGKISKAHRSCWASEAKTGKQNSNSKATYRGFVQYFDGKRLGEVLLPQSLIELLERRTVPFPKHHQVNVTVSHTHSTAFNIL